MGGLRSNKKKSPGRVQQDGFSSTIFEESTILLTCQSKRGDKPHQNDTTKRTKGKKEEEAVLLSSEEDQKNAKKKGAMSLDHCLLKHLGKMNRR